jgi:hypothetical protein
MTYDGIWNYHSNSQEDVMLGKSLDSAVRSRSSTLVVVIKVSGLKFKMSELSAAQVTETSNQIFFNTFKKASHKAVSEFLSTEKTAPGGDYGRCEICGPHLI